MSFFHTSKNLFSLSKSVYEPIFERDLLKTDVYFFFKYLLLFIFSEF